MANSVAEKEAVAVAKFSVVADHPRNSDLIIQSVPGVRLRSQIRGDRPVVDQESGRSMIPADQAAYLGQFPPMPGMVLNLDPVELTYSVVDPLADDEDACEEIRKAMERAATFRGKGKLKGVPRTSGKLDRNRMKTACREMRRLLDLGHVREHKGSVPTLAQCDAMPGRYLLNPGSQVPNGQPQFEDDIPAWQDRLNRLGE